MQGKAGLIAATGLFAILATPSLGDQLPRFDVESHCRRVASVGGAYSASLDQGCFSMEQEAYDALKPVWSTIPSSTRQHCTAVAKVGGAGSYSLLQGCVEMETEAMRDNSSRAFKY